MVVVASVSDVVVSVGGSGRNSCGCDGGVYTRGRNGRGAIVEVDVIGAGAGSPAVSLPSGFGLGSVKFVVGSTFVSVA